MNRLCCSFTLLLSIVFALLPCHSTPANPLATPPLQISLEENHGGYFSGTIGEKLDIQVFLHPRDKEFTGSYRYSTSLQSLHLDGKRSSEGVWNLREWQEPARDAQPVDGEPPTTGLWEGTESADGHTVTGFWFSPDRKKKLPLHLTKTAALQTLKAPLNIEANIPGFLQATDRNVNDRLLQELKARMEAKHTVLKTVIEELTQDNREDIAELRERISASFQVDIEAVTPTLLSFLVTDYDYQGGAHSNWTFSALNWYREKDGTFKPLVLADLFDAGKKWIVPLAALLEKDLQKQRASFITEAARSFPQNLREEKMKFTLTPAALVFHFAPYEVGCFAEGEFHVALPWKTLRTLLKTGIPASLFPPAAP